MTQFATKLTSPAIGGNGADLSRVQLIEVESGPTGVFKRIVAEKTASVGLFTGLDERYDYF